MSKEVIFAGLLAVGCLILVVVAFIAPHKPKPVDTVKTETTETVSPETDITATTGGTATGGIAQNTTVGTTTGTAFTTAGTTTGSYTSGGFTSATGGGTGSTGAFSSTGGTTTTFTGGSGSTTGFSTGGTTAAFTGGGSTGAFSTGSSTGFSTGGTTSSFTGGSTSGGLTSGGGTTGGTTTLNPTEKSHVVAAGETLGEISQKYYGSGKYWKKIVEANPGLDPNTIKVGQKLVIPALKESTTTDTHAPTPGPGERTYTVKSGDSYYTIAKRELGQASRWKEIEKLNGIGAEELHVGQVIKLPAKKDASSGSSTSGSTSGDSHSSGATGKTHTVAGGETLSDISKQYFGTTARWKDIVKANPGVDPEALKVGQKLIIPDAPADTSSSSSSSSNLAGDGSDYVVKKGDTLPVIAEHELGDRNAWKKILAANPGLEPTKLRVGQKIKLPAGGHSKSPALDDTRPSPSFPSSGGSTFGGGTSGAFSTSGGTTGGARSTASGGTATPSYTAGSGTGAFSTSGTSSSTGFSTTSGTTGGTRRSDTLAPP